MSKKKRERTLPETEAKAVVGILRVQPAEAQSSSPLIRGKKVYTRARRSGVLA